MRAVYKFHFACGRMGDLAGVFIADDKTEVEPALGLQAYFGEVLGKHSEIVLDALKPEHLTILTAEVDFVEKFDRFGLSTGFNPLNYISCKDCGNTLDPPYTSCACGWERG